MKINDVKTLADINPGNTLLISDGHEIKLVKAQVVKVSEQDGTEIIIDKKRNKFFSMELYLTSQSWVKDVKILQP